MQATTRCQALQVHCGGSSCCSLGQRSQLFRLRARRRCYLCYCSVTYNLHMHRVQALCMLQMLLPHSLARQQNQHVSPNNAATSSRHLQPSWVQCPRLRRSATRHVRLQLRAMHTPAGLALRLRVSQPQCRKARYRVQQRRQLRRSRACEQRSLPSRTPLTL